MICTHSSPGRKHDSTEHLDLAHTLVEEVDDVYMAAPRCSYQAAREEARHHESPVLNEDDDAASNNGKKSPHRLIC
jgi:hypothetical protein